MQHLSIVTPQIANAAEQVLLDLRTEWRKKANRAYNADKERECNAATCVSLFITAVLFNEPFDPRDAR